MDQPIDSCQQLHTQRRLEAINKRRCFFQSLPVNFCFHALEIKIDPFSSRVIEPDHIERTGISDSLVAVQIAPIKRIEQMSQSMSVRTILVGLETYG